MATLESLPADQRAVLQLVLGRGRSYDDIAAMLSIDRAGVRERALAALDALGPESDIDPVRRGLITDFLLGQLPRAVATQVEGRLAEHPDERAWARVVAGELVPLGADRLPEIPVAAGSRGGPDRQRSSDVEPDDSAEAASRAAPADRLAPARSTTERSSPGGRRSSRRGGALLLAAGLLIILAVILIAALTGGGSSHKTASASTSTATTSTAATTSGTSSARPIAQVNLTSPAGGKTPGGAAVVVRQGGQTGLVIRAVGLTPNSKHNAYAVWLVVPGGTNQILGFVNPAVGTNGILQTAGVLPAGASRFKQILVTLETQAKPKTPGTIVLQGALNLTG